MLVQGLTAGIGLLFIIPLLQVVGIDFNGADSAGASNLAHQVFSSIGVEPTLVNILISYVLIITTIATLRYQLSVISAQVQQAYISHLRDSLFRRLLYSNWQFIIESKMSDLTHCLSGQVQSIGQASHLMLTLLSQAVLSIVMIILVLLLSWKMTVLAFICSSILLCILLPFNRLIYNSGQTQLINFKLIFQMLTEQLASLKMIKSYGSESFYAKKMQEVSHSLESQHLRFTRMNAMTQWVYMVGSVIAFSVFFYVAQHMFEMPLASILLLLIIFSRLLPQISSLQKTCQQLLHKVPAFNDVSEFSQAFEQAREPSNNMDTYPQLHKKLKVQNISYHYPNKQLPVFQNLSFEIIKDQTIALVGSSGAGKSTLADLLAGLLEPLSGQIYCDDVLLEHESRIAWRNKVAYVTQEVYLFHDTVRANLSWVSKKALNDKDLWHALKLASADKFVRQLPQGLDTLIGDRGMKLSGGERQRLALARALLAEPQLLILDEATSALDYENEQNIQEALKQLHGKLTIIIIAHRETTIAHADQRIHLTSSDIPRSERSLQTEHSLSQ